MSNNRSDCTVEQTSHGCPAKIRDSLELLLEAHDYALDVDRDVWDFAVEITRLLKTGLSGSDLRWLTCKEYVVHGREVTPKGDNHRQFSATGELTLTRRTCFVLTKKGVNFTRSVLLPMESSTPAVSNRITQITENAIEEEQPAECEPCWDSDRRELRLNGQVVKRFKWQAMN